MRKLILSIMLFLLSACVTDCYCDPIFKIDSSKDRVRIPIMLCLNGIDILSCESHTVSGFDLQITANIQYPAFDHAGISILVPGFKLEGCRNHDSGFCLFYVTNKKSHHIIIKAVQYAIN